MNLGQLKKNVGYRVQLEPPAIHLDARGRELPARNEDWIIQTVTDSEVRLDEATVMGLTTTLGKDHVHHYTSNPSRSSPGGIQYGFLTLSVQMSIQQDRITYRPCARPGERVAPLHAPVAERWVDLKYPVASGIQRRLEEAGYRTAWVRASRLATLELQGWELVVENDPHGMPTSFHVRTSPENLVYTKTREPDLQALAANPFWRAQSGLVSCTANTELRALVLRFADPTSTMALQMRMARNPHQSGRRVEAQAGRVDTVLAYPVSPVDGG